MSSVTRSMHNWGGGVIAGTGRSVRVRFANVQITGGRSSIAMSDLTSRALTRGVWIISRSEPSKRVKHSSHRSNTVAHTGDSYFFNVLNIKVRAPYL